MPEPFIAASAAHLRRLLPYLAEPRIAQAMRSAIAATPAVVTPGRGRSLSPYMPEPGIGIAMRSAAHLRRLSPSYA